MADSNRQPASLPPLPAADPQPQRADGLLAGMRIREKLIVLHTCFSLVLAGILALALRPPISEVVKRAELHEAELILQTIRDHHGSWRDGLPGIDIRTGDAAAVNIDPDTAARARAQPGQPLTIESPGQPPRLVLFDRPPTASGAEGSAARDGTFTSVSTRLAGSRSAVLRIYLLLTIALLAVYALVAAALEIFVLPRQVYEPIQRLRDADRAVQEGRRDEEIIPESAMPADELGEIMRSRNRSISTMRQQEQQLAASATELGRVAADLKRKNHLLEMARQNLADADRLASLGLMSAGLSHELNTPLAVLKGLAEKLVHDRASMSADEADLMLRVVGRLERLSESLLDFARVRPPRTAPVALNSLIDEAWTLVSLDRDPADIKLAVHIPESLIVECDADRIVQVLVNLLRNAVDAMTPAADTSAAQPPSPARLDLAAETLQRDGRDWVSLTIADSGPGIDPEVLGRLFEPFVSTRLDAQGTGLGLAVAEGIIKEHGGLILARNRSDTRGALFEIILPLLAPPSPQSELPPQPTPTLSVHF